MLFSSKRTSTAILKSCSYIYRPKYTRVYISSCNSIIRHILTLERSLSFFFIPQKILKSKLAIKSLDSNKHIHKGIVCWLLCIEAYLHCNLIVWPFYNTGTAAERTHNISYICFGWRGSFLYIHWLVVLYYCAEL